MTPLGRAALVLGLVLVASAFAAGLVTVHAGQHDCGSAVSAHAPQEQFARPVAESRAEDQCDGKITGRRRLVGVLGVVGLVVAIAGAYTHERSATRDSG
jgi:hypothetical protein